MAELLPCPFCGGKAEVCTEDSYYILGKKYYVVKCSHFCVQQSFCHSSKSEAINAWNTRTPKERGGRSE